MYREKEKIFKYRDTTETFENILAEVFHSHNFRFEIIRDKKLFLNFYRDDKIVFHFDVDENVIMEYSYIKGDTIKYITDRIYDMNLVSKTYNIQENQKRTIYDNISTGNPYKFNLYSITVTFNSETITQIYKDKTKHIIFIRRDLKCD